MAEVKSVKQLVRTAMCNASFWRIEDGNIPKWAKPTVNAYPEAFVLQGKEKPVKELEPLKALLKKAGLPSFGILDCSDDYYGTRGLVVIPKSAWKAWEVEPSTELCEWQAGQQQTATVEF